MEPSKKNYWNWAFITAGLYFAGLFLVYASQLKQDLIEAGSEQTGINGIWYFLAVVFAAAAAAGIAWFFCSKYNSLSKKEVLESKKRVLALGFTPVIFAAALGFCIAGSGTVLNFDFSLPTVDVSTIAQAGLDAQQNQQEEQNHEFPDQLMPDVLPVVNLVDQAYAVTTVDDEQTLYSVSAAYESGQSAVLVQNEGRLSILQAYASKSGGLEDPSLAMDYGINSALLVTEGGTLSLLGTSVYTAGYGAPAIAANGANATVSASSAKVQTVQEYSPLVFAGFSGMAQITSSTMYASASDSPAFLARAGAYITTSSSLVQTYKYNSPVIDAQGAFDAESLNANALGSVFSRQKAGSSITLTDSTISAAGSDAVTEEKGLFVLADDNAKNATAATLTLTDTSAAFNSTGNSWSDIPMFYVSGIQAQISLSESTLSMYSSTAAIFENAIGSITMDKQRLTGAITADADSKVDIVMENGSVFAGSINRDDSGAEISLKLSSDSTISLTGDLYLTEFENESWNNSNIQANGYSIYVNGESVL
jgi:hypothetical protein